MRYFVDEKCEYSHIIKLRHLTWQTAEKLTKYLGAVEPANENRSLPSTIRINMTEGPLPTYKRKNIINSLK